MTTVLLEIQLVYLWQVNFPYKECNLKNRLDTLLLQELKETFCHLSQVHYLIYI